METRRDSLSVLKLCRFCLSQDGTLTTLYERKRTPKNTVTLPLKILSCMSIEVFPSDKMLSYICQRCKFFMDIAYEFKQICRQADEDILQFIQKGTPLGTIQWPSILTEVYPEKIKPSSDLSILETMGDNASEQVTMHDASDSEEDGHMIDIKLGDGSDEGSKGTTIKFIASTDEDVKRKPIRSRKDSDEIEMVYGRANPSGGITDGCWPCDECDCTYPLQQLLELHKMQKHRERTVRCDRCDAKFFTQYDLAVHQLRHTDDMPFQCVACDKQFKRLILLKRHEKLMHADLQQQHCPSCPASFLSVEELDAHQLKHGRPVIKQFVCMICEKKFQDRASLQRHRDMIHEKKAAFCCEYCPESFGTISKLTRHVRSHAGVRGYPCKYCEKSFLKSHHYTRHLRLKHPESVRLPKERLNDHYEEYRCDQCEDIFNSQDDLIYHSAIHATQNLICPLCQEKFGDVEAVTAHIKSHVNGTEFMCDLCELIFTTEEKLHNHMISSHEDEMRNADQEMDHDESSMEMDAEDEDDDNTINLKEENDHMVVEIKKAHEFMLTNDPEEKMDNTISEDSEPETTYAELATVDTLALTKETPELIEKPSAKSTASVITKLAPAVSKTEKSDNQTASILRKAEDVKRKLQQPTESISAREKKAIVKSETSAPVRANDKSLRLLEKELQELKRTNKRSTETLKTSAKNLEILRSKRPQIHTSTPKPTRVIEEKKPQIITKAAVPDKKQPERRLITKENKEPKEQKSITTTIKEEKETPKSNVKNGTNDKSLTEDSVRRSTRPSKIKDYAKMINDRAQDSDDDKNSDYIEESEEEEHDHSIEIRAKGRRASVKPAVQAPGKSTPTPTTVTATPAPRKRGRPRKDKGIIPTKIKKEGEEEETKAEKSISETAAKAKDAPTTTENTKEPKTPERNANPESDKPVSEQKSPSNILVSPTGQTLKKVPMKALPPGIKPLPLPVNARPIAGGEVCEMQIGKKVVKVQKIVMTKAEVEAMAKKGLVEMKDGTMVLKQGIKIPTSDPAALKSSLVGDTNLNKESPAKKGAPTRCDIDDA